MMSDIAEHIEGSDKITSVFGYWPSFHDAEILCFELRRGGVGLAVLTPPVLTLQVRHWQMTNEVKPDGYFVHEHETISTLRFYKVDDVKLDGFNRQNVIFDLRIERKEQHFDVALEPCFGIEASFTCARIEVVDVQPTAR